MPQDNLHREDERLSHPPLFPLEDDNALTPGTLVLTLDGELPVEFLSAGDLIITRDAGIVQLRDVRHTVYLTHAVAILPGALGNHHPQRRIVVPASQSILLRGPIAQRYLGRDRALVAAGHLTHGAGLQDLGAKPLSLFTLVFNDLHIVVADGLDLACAVAPIGPPCAAGSI